MKSVLISIQPKWCELIAEGDKTIEVRKTAPKIETPFRCLIYCTNKKLAKDSYLYINNKDTPEQFGATCRFDKAVDLVVNEYSYLKDFHSYRAFGRVIGEFTCNKINITAAEWVTREELYKSCLTQEQLKNYSNKKAIYLWHISDLKLYDEPKYLSELNIERPPQSWQYVDV